jgi:hypothetical protein
MFDASAAHRRFIPRAKTSERLRMSVLRWTRRMTVRETRSWYRFTPCGGAKGTVGSLWDILAILRAKAAATDTGRSLDCGHFLQEERPEETFDELQQFFGTA